MEKVKATIKNLVKGPEKWLLVSAFGVLLCIISLIMHLNSGAKASTPPLPKTVLAQVFGFNTYYFRGDKPPKGLKLDATSAKFINNTFSFNLIDGKKQKVTVSQKAPAGTSPSTAKENTTPMTTSLGTALVNPVKNGHISATLVTKDQTEITVESSDLLNTTIMQEIYNTLAPIDRATGSPLVP